MSSRMRAARSANVRHQKRCRHNVSSVADSYLVPSEDKVYASDDDKTLCRVYYGLMYLIHQLESG
jgi:hypothetical protein